MGPGELNAAEGGEEGTCNPAMDEHPIHGGV